MSTTTGAIPSDGESRVPNVIAMVAGTLAVGALTTAARFYTRLVIVKNLGIDDWFALLSLLCTIGCGVCEALNTQNGLGRHMSDIDMTRFPLYLKIFYVSIVTYGAAITSVKATFLLQYQRLFSVGGYVNRFLWALLVVMAWSIASLLIAIFTCVPVEGFWDQSVNSYCIPEHPWWEINSAGNVITDFAVFCLPLPTLWKLCLPRGQKIALLGIFSLGFFTCVLSIVRIKYLHIQDDLPWDNVDSGTWSMIELVSGITCANLATLRPLLKAVFPSLSGSTPSGAPQSSSNGTPHGEGHVTIGSQGKASYRRWSMSRSSKSATGGDEFGDVEMLAHDGKPGAEISQVSITRES